MFALAFIIGIFSYVLFFIGLVGLLYKPLVIIITISYVALCIFIYRKSLNDFLKNIRYFRYKLSSFFGLCVGILIVQMIINLIGAFGPEIGFDALWYHLTLPKLYLLYHTVVHIPGGLLYYSDMPKLTEMLYTAGLSFGLGSIPKLMHFGFGILICSVLYKLCRKFVSKELSILAVVVFYSNLVVGWESVSAYVDLARTFFEVVSLFAFVTYWETKRDTWLNLAALVMGLAITTKLISLFSLVVYVVALLLQKDKRKYQQVGKFVVLSFLVPLPWLVFSFIHTGNPFYPIFSSSMSVNVVNYVNPLRILGTVWTTFTHAPDPISPVYIACVPFLFVYWKLLKEYQILFYLGLGFFLSWLVIPQFGETRFLLAYLPLFSLLVVIFLSKIIQQKIKIPFLIFIFITFFISLFYRGVANAKFVPVIFGKQTQAQFLSNHLNFSYGDFYDTDGYFASHIKPTDRVLLYGFHNLYYVDFPFIDSSWVQKKDTFDYVAIQGAGTPERFRYWNLIYFNPLTQVRLYYLKGYSWYF